MSRSRLSCHIVAALFLLPACAQIDSARDWLQSTLVNFVPHSIDVRIGQDGLASLLQKTPPVDEPAVTAVIDELAAPLLAAARQDFSVPYRVIVTKDPTVNAYALPGGPIILPAGFLLLFTESPAEVQGVMAHEFAHITRRHSMQQAMAGIGLALLLPLILGDASEFVRFLTGIGSDLFMKEHSRNHESEADSTGAQYLNQAQIGTAGLIAFFERLQQDQKAGRTPKLLQGILSTHPVTQERIEALRKLNDPADGRSNVSLASFKRLQAQLREYGAR